MDWRGINEEAMIKGFKVVYFDIHQMVMAWPEP